METRTPAARAAVEHTRAGRVATKKAANPDIGLTVAAVIARVATGVAGGEPFIRLLMTRLEAVHDEAEREIRKSKQRRGRPSSAVQIPTTSNVGGQKTTAKGTGAVE